MLKCVTFPASKHINIVLFYAECDNAIDVVLQRQSELSLVREMSGTHIKHYCTREKSCCVKSCDTGHKLFKSQGNGVEKLVLDFHEQIGSFLIELHDFLSALKYILYPSS